MDARRTVVVVGAGAAGLTAALRAAGAGAAVTLLNAHPRIGLKILMSGGTRCNVTHRVVTERDYHGGSRHFVRRVLAAFTPEQTREWFERLGVALVLEETGKYFPESNDAATVLGALLGAVESAGVAVRAGVRAVRLERAPGLGGAPPALESAAGQVTVRAEPGTASRPGRRSRAAESPARPGATWRVGLQPIERSAAFAAEAAEHGRVDWPLPAVEVAEWLAADAVIVATGGLSFPRTGSDGTGYALVRALGHTLVPPVPALTPLASDDPICRELSGVAVDAELTLETGSRSATTVSGSLLFAHFGLTGPVALDFSRHWLRAEGGRDTWLNLAPGRRAEDLTAEWTRAVASEPRRSVRRHLAAWLPERLAARMCDEAGIDPATPIAQVDRARRAALIERCVRRPLEVRGTLGYEKAEVTAGGVALSEVSPSTLESRIAPGLFLCGEILDVEGRLGGFNFQWAWSSGTVAGRAAARVLSTDRMGLP